MPRFKRQTRASEDSEYKCGRAENDRKKKHLTAVTWQACCRSVAWNRAVIVLRALALYSVVRPIKVAGARFNIYHQFFQRPLSSR